METAPVPFRHDNVVLDIGSGAGALVLRSGPELANQEIEIVSAAGQRTHVWVLARRVGSGAVMHAAVFTGLAPGVYQVPTSRGWRRVGVEADTVTEVDLNATGTDS